MQKSRIQKSQPFSVSAPNKFAERVEVFVTDCVKMYENRQFENAGSNRLDQASLASMIGDADDAQSREVYGSIWPRMRKLLPSMTTVSAWCSSRSRMAAVRVLSLLNILGHSLNARFEVSMIEPCS
jgi:hypothetical protein